MRLDLPTHPPLTTNRSLKLLNYFLRIACALSLLASLPSTVEGQNSSQSGLQSPTRIRAGRAFLGEGRKYSSPTAYDINGDGKVDIFIGDLEGSMTLAKGAKKGKNVQFGKEKPAKNSQGGQLTFNNW